MYRDGTHRPIPALERAFQIFSESQANLSVMEMGRHARIVAGNKAYLRNIRPRNPPRSIRSPFFHRQSIDSYYQKMIRVVEARASEVEPSSEWKDPRMSPKDQSLHGILPALCTPFAPDGSLDLDAQRQAVRFVLAGGASGIVCFGLAGEVNKLTPEERKEVAAVIIGEVGGRVPVLVGVGAEALHTSKDLARFAESAGADGIVVPPPITSHCDEGGLAPYFAEIADSTTLPMVIQDAPAYLGMKLSAAGIRRLAEAHPNIKYVKVESGPEETAHWVAQLSPLVKVLTGNAGVFLIDDIQLGAVGNVPGTELTDMLVSVYHDQKAGRGSAARDRFNSLLPYLMFSLQGMDHYNACTKEVMVRRGVLMHAGLRLPAPGLDATSIQVLDRLLADIELKPYTEMAVN